MITKNADNKLLHLQMLRAICASLVVIDHSLGIAGVTSKNLLQAGAFLGEMGVYTFFVLSGLIIMRQSSGMFGKPGSPWIFASRRIQRIVPLYWLITLISVAQWGMFSSYSPHFHRHLLKSLLFIPYEGWHSYWLPLVGQGWTLNCEMFFYALFTFSLMMNRRRGAAILLLIFFCLFLIGEFRNPWHNEPKSLLDFYTSIKMLPFVFGLLIACWEIKFGKGIQFQSRLSPSLLLLLPALGLLFFAHFANFSRFDFWPRGLNLTGSFCVLVVVLCFLARNPIRMHPLESILEKLGDASYSTYLFHYFLLQVLIFPLYTKCIPVHLQDLWVWLLFALILVNLMGWLTYLYIEKPLTRAVRQAIAWFEASRKPEIA